MALETRSSQLASQTEKGRGGSSNRLSHSRNTSKPKEGGKASRGPKTATLKNRVGWGVAGQDAGGGRQVELEEGECFLPAATAPRPPPAAGRKSARAVGA